MIPWCSTAKWSFLRANQTIQTLAGSRRAPGAFHFHLMRLHPVILPLLAALATAAAETSAPGTAKTTTAPAAREAAIEQLLAARESPKALADAITTARELGVSEQTILEARFLYHVDRREDQALAAMLPDLLKQRDNFKLEDSAIFAVTEDWLAVIEYVQAVAALGKNDRDSFKQHITEAFWLSPRQAAAFAPHIERLRLNECMRQVKIDFTTKLAPLAAGDAVALEQLIAGKKALLFHFWSPLNPECEAAMPDFIPTAVTLSANDIAVVSLLVGDSPKLLTDSRAMIHQLGAKPPGAWLIDTKEKPFARLLRIQNLPAMVLVSTSGKILFNGDPTETEFWQTLHQIDARIARPKSTRADAE